MTNRRGVTRIDQETLKGNFLTVWMKTAADGEAPAVVDRMHPEDFWSPGKSRRTIAQDRGTSTQ